MTTPAIAETRLDRLIGYLWPTRALRRTWARTQAMQLRRYEGAASGRRTDAWRATNTSANTEIQADLQKLRDRSRDLVRNNAWVARAVNAIAANVVGYGITAKLSSLKKNGAVDDANTATLTKLWSAWAETLDCDADGRHDIYGLQFLMMRAVPESGELLIRRRWRKPTDGFAVPMQLQLCEGDYLDHAKTGLADNGNRIIQGVEFNFFGQRTAYWMFQDHPGDTGGKTGESKPVPAVDVIHLYRQDRIGQVRGVPWGASAFITIRDLDDYEDAYLFRQKIANLFVGAIKDSDPDSPAATAGGTDANPLPLTMEPGAFPLLPTGKDVTFSTPPPAGDYGAFTKDVLLKIAASYGITYAALTGDLSSVNFSSGRMGNIEFAKNIDAWRWTMLIPSALTRIAEWFAEAAAVEVGTPKKVKSEWAAPPREMIDPSREVPAITARLRSGQQTLPQYWREAGMNPELVMQEIADTNARLTALGIVLDSDPRNVSQAGLTQARPAGSIIPASED